MSFCLQSYQNWGHYTQQCLDFLHKISGHSSPSEQTDNSYMILNWLTEVKNVYSMKETVQHILTIISSIRQTPVQSPLRNSHLTTLKRQFHLLIIAYGDYLHSPNPLICSKFSFDAQSELRRISEAISSHLCPSRFHQSPPTDPGISQLYHEITALHRQLTQLSAALPESVASQPDTTTALFK